MEIESLGTQTQGHTERLPSPLLLLLLLLLLQLHLPRVAHKESRPLPHSAQLYYNGRECISLWNRHEQRRGVVTVYQIHILSYLACLWSWLSFFLLLLQFTRYTVSLKTILHVVMHLIKLSLCKLLPDLEPFGTLVKQRAIQQELVLWDKVSHWQPGISM